ncbi:PhzF family phenazine biosynthesis protein [Domibacillus epiphyticus]|uniref:Phenazine biosynthesis protein PhzF family n=1 Tax=Domibacillus epiphyticus TaxID=1714355 RepID=A0A1V2AA25_9BACI|nr:PhzF family phenazine biosynthesis protein [Domibacillus epiphyticus]OMP67848.1 phenazine biosynthesis protein PhzF family [Domibacillus epiphyticus]
MHLSIFNTFTDRAFRGNPAAVCLIKEEKTDHWMQQVASEINLPVTAFIRTAGEEFQLRWFTPSTEIPICGHGTLASGYFLWENKYVQKEQSIHFQTKSGVVTANLVDDWVQLWFPALYEKEVETPEFLVEALGVKPVYIGQNQYDLLVEVASEEMVREMNPDIELISRMSVRGVIVTARSDTPDLDFVSRFFSPAQGLNEDYVTGSAHCCLGPYWKKKMGKHDFTAYQSSERGGLLKVNVEGNKVRIAGKVTSILDGRLTT